MDSSTVTLLDLQPQDIISAWSRGDIDAAYTWLPSLAELQKTGKVLVTSRELAGDGKPTLDLGVASTAFIDDHPDAISAWRKVQARALRLIADDPDAAAEAVGRQLGISPDDAAQQLSQGVFLDPADEATDEWLGTPGKPGNLAANLQDAGKFLVDQNQIPEAPSLEAYQAAIYNDGLEDDVRDE